MSHIKWKEKYGPKVRPAYDELLAFLPEHTARCFQAFNSEMAETYHVYNKWQRYEKTSGWVYGYCRNYRCELLSVTIGDGCFHVLGIAVCDEDSLKTALAAAKKAYDGGYEEKYARVSATKRTGQIERTKVRLAREKEQMAKLAEDLDPAKLNKFKWVPKVSRDKLVRLYTSDADGMLDEDLLDDIGYTFYTRCVQSRKTLPLLNEGRMICHHCDAIFTASGYASLTRCECGYCYTYREYRRSFNAHNMPAHRAQPVFDAFMDKWPKCKTAKEKMLLTDWLIHECHTSVMSGLKGRSVCMNLMEGTATQLRNTLEKLAGH